MSVAPPSTSVALPAHRPAAAVPVAAPRARSRRLLLGWSASSVPVAPLILIGMILGPHGLAVLSDRALGVLDPAIPVALAALGVLVGMDLRNGRPSVRSLRPAGGLHAALTMCLVGFGMYGLMQMDLVPAVTAWLLPAVCGICAAPSLTLPGRPLAEPRRATDALVESEVVVAILFGAVLLSALARDTLLGPAVLLVEGLGLTLLLALAGWLLVRRTTSTTERRVFTMATLLLVGGAADFLSASALFGGLAAGFFWNRMGGTPLETLQAETLYIQHPLVVLLLLVAGARAELSWLTAGLAAAYVSLRVTGRLLGGRLLRRLPGARTPDLPLQLAAPGVFGVAFALNVGRVVGVDTAGVTAAVSVVVLGTVLSDFAARLAAARGGPA